MQNIQTSACPPARGHVAHFSSERALCEPERLLFASSDLDQVRSMVGQVIANHHLKQTHSAERLDARMHYLNLGDISLSRLRYGASVQIERGALENCFLVQMPLQGTAMVESGRQRIDSSLELASVLSPGDSANMHWAGDSEQIMVRISRSLVERTLVGHLGHPLEHPLRFELGFRWQESAPWRGLLSYLLDCANHYPLLAQHKLVMTHIEQLAASTLLMTHKHNYSDTAPARRNTILPRHVRRAQDYLQSHAHEPITAEQLALAAGVSLRSLYTGFRDFLGVSPMHYLRDLRMEQVHAELVSGEATNIAGVALRWGFTHMGRFSNDYKLRYGEMPSQTLRRH